MIREYRMPQLVAVGTVAGSAVGTVTSTKPFAGRFLGAYIDYSGTATTQDITIATTGTPVTTFVTVSNNATDGWYWPRAQICGVDGAALTYDGTYKQCEAIPFVGYVQASLAQGGTAGDTVDVTLMLEE